MEKIEKKIENQELTFVSLKGTLSSVPFIGSLLSEAITVFLPNYRYARYDAYIKILSTKFSSFDLFNIKKQFDNEEFIDLIEDSIRYAIKAISIDRKEYIASIVKNSISNENIDFLRDKYLLSLLSELNDIEIIILQYYHKNRYLGGGNEFYKKHKDILDSDRVTLRSSNEKHEQALIYKNYKQHLVRLGLLDETFEDPPFIKNIQGPNMDYKTGKIKSKDFRINNFGEYFLKYLDLTDEEKI